MAKKTRQSPSTGAKKPVPRPNSNSPAPADQPTLSTAMRRAIAIGIKEITRGASDQQVTLSLQDAGINLKDLPPDFVTRLRGGASFKPKPPKPDWRKKSK